MATKESLHQFIDDVAGICEKGGLEPDLIKAYPKALNMRGKGAKQTIVLTFEVHLDPNAFVTGDLRPFMDKRTGYFGMGFMVPKEYLKHSEEA